MKRPEPEDEISLGERFESLFKEDREAITAIHAALANIKMYPEQYSDPVQAIEDMEFTLQHLWGFTRDLSYHTHWIEIAGCTCPKMDNRDMIFRGRRIINSYCKWHAIV
ncbi:hypothetical protein D3C85_894050 [compost metagenome]